MAKRRQTSDSELHVPIEMSPEMAVYFDIARARAVEVTWTRLTAPPALELPLELNGVLEWWSVTVPAMEETWDHRNFRRGDGEKSVPPLTRAHTFYGRVVRLYQPRIVLDAAPQSGDEESEEFALDPTILGEARRVMLLEHEAGGARRHCGWKVYWHLGDWVASNTPPPELPCPELVATAEEFMVQTLSAIKQGKVRFDGELTLRHAVDEDIAGSLHAAYGSVVELVYVDGKLRSITGDERERVSPSKRVSPSTGLGSPSTGLRSWSVGSPGLGGSSAARLGASGDASIRLTLPEWVRSREETREMAKAGTGEMGKAGLGEMGEAGTEELLSDEEAIELDEWDAL